MADGAFAGGFAQGFGEAQTRALAERAQTERTALGNRGLALQEQVQRHAQSQDYMKRADAIYQEYIGQITEAVKGAHAVGKDPKSILRAVAPIVEAADQIGTVAGRKPGSALAATQAMLVQPGLVETAAATGKAKAASSIAEQETINKAVGAGVVTAEQLASPFGTLKEKLDHIDKLRDDYFKQSNRFNQVSDYFGRIQVAENNAVGDISRIFSYIKLLDPTSTVSPGEQATARNTTGVPEQLMLLYNRMLNSQGKENEIVLSTNQRNQFLSNSKKIFDRVEAEHKKVREFFAESGKRAKINPKSIMPDYTGPDSDFPMATPSGIGFKVVK